MSFFSVLGKIGSTVGKVGLGAVGGVLNTATGGLTSELHLATVFDKDKTAAPAVAASLHTYPPDTQNAGGGGLLGVIKNFFGAATGVLQGKTHLQADLHTEVGGTQDVYGNASNGLPSWLLPVGIAAVVLFLFTGKGHR